MKGIVIQMQHWGKPKKPRGIDPQSFTAWADYYSQLDYTDRDRTVPRNFRYKALRTYLHGKFEEDENKTKIKENGHALDPKDSYCSHETNRDIFHKQRNDDQVQNLNGKYAVDSEEEDKEMKLRRLLERSRFLVENTKMVLEKCSNRVDNSANGTLMPDRSDKTDCLMAAKCKSKSSCYSDSEDSISLCIDQQDNLKGDSDTESDSSHEEDFMSVLYRIRANERAKKLEIDSPPENDVPPDTTLEAVVPKYICTKQDFQKMLERRHGRRNTTRCIEPEEFIRGEKLKSLQHTYTKKLEHFPIWFLEMFFTREKLTIKMKPKLFALPDPNTPEYQELIYSHLEIDVIPNIGKEGIVQKDIRVVKFTIQERLHIPRRHQIKRNGNIRHPWRRLFCTTNAKVTECSPERIQISGTFVDDELHNSKQIALVFLHNGGEICGVYRREMTTREGFFKWKFTYDFS